MKNSHVRIVHHIAYATGIGYRLACFISFGVLGYCRFVMVMLVRINHSLPRYKADQYDPGKTNTVFSFIHYGYATLVKPLFIK
jgi:hypothetical protein